MALRPATTNNKNTKASGSKQGVTAEEIFNFNEYDTQGVPLEESDQDFLFRMGMEGSNPPLGGATPISSKPVAGGTNPALGGGGSLDDLVELIGTPADNNNATAGEPTLTITGGGSPLAAVKRPPIVEPTSWGNTPTLAPTPVKRPPIVEPTSWRTPAPTEEDAAAIATLKALNPKLEGYEVTTAKEAIDVLAALDKEEQSKSAPLYVPGGEQEVYTQEQINNDPTLLASTVSGTQAVPEYVKAVKANFEDTARIMGAMQKESVLDPKQYEELITAQADYAHALDPTNESGLVYGYLQKANAINGKIADVRKELLDMKEKKVDPDKYFNELPKAQQLTAILSRSIGNINKMAGTVPLGAQSYADFIDGQVNQDIKLQMDAMKTDREGLLTEAGLLGDELKNARNDTDGLMAYKVKAIEGVISKINTLTAQKKLSAEEKYGAGLVVLELEKKQLDECTNLYTQSFKNEFAATEDTGGMLTPLQSTEVMKVQNEVESKIVEVPIFSEDGRVVKDENGQTVSMPHVVSRGSQSQVDSVQRSVVDVLDAVETINQIDDLLSERGIFEKMLPNARKATLDSLNSSLSMSMQSYFKLGVLSEGDKVIHAEMKGDPTKLFSFDGNQLAKLRSMRGSLIRSVKTNVAQFAPQTVTNYLDSTYGGTYLRNIPKGAYYGRREEDAKRFYIGTSPKSQNNDTMQAIDKEGVMTTPEGIKYKSSLGTLVGAGNNKGDEAATNDPIFRSMTRR